jgi:hypothetical protein
MFKFTLWHLWRNKKSEHERLATIKLTWICLTRGGYALHLTHRTHRTL